MMASLENRENLKKMIEEAKEVRLMVFDPWRVLDLSFDDGEEEIGRARREKAKKYHSDQQGNGTVDSKKAAEAEERIREANRAYDALTNDSAISSEIRNIKDQLVTWERGRRSRYSYAYGDAPQPSRRPQPTRQEDSRKKEEDEEARQQREQRARDSQKREEEQFNQWKESIRKAKEALEKERAEALERKTKASQIWNFFEAEGYDYHELMNFSSRDAAKSDDPQVFEKGILAELLREVSKKEEGKEIDFVEFLEGYLHRYLCRYLSRRGAYDYFEHSYLKQWEKLGFQSGLLELLWRKAVKGKNYDVSEICHALEDANTSRSGKIEHNLNVLDSSSHPILVRKMELRIMEREVPYRRKRRSRDGEVSFDQFVSAIEKLRNWYCGPYVPDEGGYSSEGKTLMRDLIRQTAQDGAVPSPDEYIRKCRHKEIIGGVYASSSFSHFLEAGVRCWTAKKLPDGKYVYLKMGNPWSPEIQSGGKDR